MSDVHNDNQLPSDAPTVVDVDTFIKENTNENGKLFGRFDDIPSALTHFRDQEVTHTNNMRELKEAQKTLESSTQEQIALAEAKQAKENTIGELLPSFVNNNMVFDDETTTKLESAGIDSTEFKLRAYELRDTMTNAYNTVGGRENYTAMMEWADKNLSDTLKASFDRDIKSPLSELAIEGLNSRYQASLTAEQPTPERVSGGVAAPSVHGYSTQAEMFADKRASDNNPTLRRAYKAKLALTPDNVIYGH